MRKFINKYFKVIVFTLLFFGIITSFSCAQELPKGELSILLTSSGQSPDAFVVKVLLDRAKIESSYNGLVNVDEIKDIKTLIIVMGGSTKGLGAAGIDEKFELERSTKIIDEAIKQGILVLGIHIGGEGRRGPLSQQFIDLVAPRTKGLIVTEEGNKDGYFSNLSKDKNIPLVVVTTTPEVGGVLQKVFQADVE